MRDRSFSYLIIAFVVFEWLCLGYGTIYGRDLNGQWDKDPNHSWFAKQKNSAGISCCETADGHHVNDTDWKWQDDAYWVKTAGVNGCTPDAWCKVPPEAVINPLTRPVDYAVVWVAYGRIWCFMAGAGS